MDPQSQSCGRAPQSNRLNASAVRPAFHAATMLSLVVGALIAAAPLPSHGAPIAEKDYRELVTSTSRSCYATQRAAATSQGIPDAEIRDYCSCYVSVRSSHLDVGHAQQPAEYQEPGLQQPESPPI